jgi:hypothetical protein
MYRHQNIGQSHDIIINKSFEIVAKYHAPADLAATVTNCNDKYKVRRRKFGSKEEEVKDYGMIA